MSVNSSGGAKNASRQWCPRRPGIAIVRILVYLVIHFEQGAYVVSQLWSVRISGKISIAILAVLCFSSFARADEFVDVKHNQKPTGSLALTMGTPAGFNLSLNHIGSGNWGWTVAGGYVSGGSDCHLTGVQLGVLKSHGFGRNHYTALSFHAGYMEAACDDVGLYAGYVGGGFIWKWRALYTQVDLNVGSWEEEYSNPQLGAQIGVVLMTFYSGGE